MANDFKGEKGKPVPDLPDSFVTEISERYIELFENITGKKFVKADISEVNSRIGNNVTAYLKEIGF